MKKIYFVIWDHQDLLWNKGFNDYFTNADQDLVRSYRDREELQMDRMLELTSRTEAKFSFEQTWSIKKYLEFHPDKTKLFRDLVQKGKIEITGCGESVIDYNLVLGESIIRNHLYSIWYCQKTFGVRPESAAVPDTFGLSAQMPQILRQLGYSNLSNYSRVFGESTALHIEIPGIQGKPVKPFWQGLDGSLICISSLFEDQGTARLSSHDNYQYESCPCCGGEGCRFCEYTGMDFMIQMGNSTMERLIGDFVREDRFDRAVYHSGTEEMIRQPNFTGQIKALKKKLGVSIEFVTNSEILKKFTAPYTKKLNSGEVEENQIDCRREGNPVANGCHTGRSLLKRQNRQMEHLLLTAEKFAAFAVDYGLLYPGKKLAVLWNQLAFFQFHDNITASHPDGPYEELQRYARWILRGAGKICLEAMRTMAGFVELPERIGHIPILVFNPLNWTVDFAETQIVLPRSVLENREVKTINVSDSHGTPLLVTRIDIVVFGDTSYIQVDFIAKSLPSMGYSTVFAEPVYINGEREEAAAFITGEAEGLKQLKSSRIVQLKNELPLKQSTIENRYYRVSFNDREAIEAWDKETGVQIIASPGLQLVAEDDIGSPWETLAHFGRKVTLTEISEITCSSLADPNGQLNKLVIKGRLNKPYQFDIPADWESDILIGDKSFIRKLKADEAPVIIRSLEWKLTLTLHKDQKRIDIKTNIICDSSNVRLSAEIPAGFKTKDNKAWFHIPGGVIERESYDPVYNYHCGTDGTWPALHFAAVNNNDNYTVGYLNRGIAAHRWSEGVMKMVLLRSPQVYVWSSTTQENLTDYQGAKDSGENSFEFALISGKGSWKDNHLVHRGWEYNTPFLSVLALETPWAANGPTLCDPPAEVKGLTEEHSFLQTKGETIITAVKQKETGDDIIVRMSESYGEKSKETLFPDRGYDVFQSGLLEEQGSKLNEINLSPFEIKTVCLKKRT